MLQYKIALVNVWWHQGDENYPYFANVDDQTAYFNALTANGDYFTPLVNFNMFNNVQTTIIYRNSSNRLPEQLIACNYAVVQWINPNSNITYYRYYFAQCFQDSGNQMRVDLQLDDIQTNYFRFKNSFEDVFIKRANITRFEQVTINDRLGYRLKLRDERFWIDEGFTPDKLYNYSAFGDRQIPLVPWMITSASEVSKIPAIGSAVYNFYKNYILGWQVLFVSTNASIKTKEYTITPDVFDYRIQDWRAEANIPQPSPIRAPYGIIVAPVYKRPNIIGGVTDEKPIIILQSNGIQYRLTNSLEAILNNEENKPFIYSVQFTQHNFLLPFLRGDSGAILHQTLDNEIQLVINCRLALSKMLPINLSDYNPNYDDNAEEHTCATKVFDNLQINEALITGYTQPSYEVLSGDVYSTQLGCSVETASRLKQFSNEISLNPKLWSSEYRCWKIEYYNGVSYTVDILRLGYRFNNFQYSEAGQQFLNQELPVTFSWSEPLSTIINQGRITYYDGSTLYSSTGIYNPYFEAIQTISDEGLIASMDLSILYYVNNYADYIANNKNYYTQRDYNLTMQTVRSSVSAGANLAGNLAGSIGNPVGAIGAALSGVGSAANIALDEINARKNSEWELDNMRGAPNSIKGNSSDILGAVMFRPFGMRLTYWTISERQLLRYNDYMLRYGFKIEEELDTLNTSDTMTTYDNNRKYWNYLECQVGTIVHNPDPLNGIEYLSNLEEERLKSALNSGVRFWNNPQIVNGQAVSPVNYNQQNYENELDN